MRLTKTEYRRRKQTQKEIEHLGKFDSQAESVAVQMAQLIARIHSVTYVIEDDVPV